MADVFPHKLQQFFLLPLRLHVDEIDDDNAADIAQTKLAQDLPCGLHIYAINGIGEIFPAHVFPRINVDNRQRLGPINDEKAPRRELNNPPTQGFDRFVYLISAKERRFILIELYPFEQLGRNISRQLANTLIDLPVINDQTVNLRCHRISDDTDRELGVAVEKRRRRKDPAPCLKRRKEPRQILYLSRQCFLRLPNGRRPHDQTHARRRNRLSDRFQPSALFLFFDAARQPYIGRRRHQHQIAPGKREVSGHPRPFLAAGVLYHLHDQRLPGANTPLSGKNAPDVGRHTVPDIEKSVLFPTDVNKRCLHPRQHVLHLAIINITNQRGMRRPFRRDFAQFAIFQKRHARFFGNGVYQNRLQPCASSV